MTSSTLWNNDKVLLLIKEYEKRELLWKKSSNQYHNVVEKEEAWRAISEIMHEDVDEVKRKIDSLRGTRRREKSRIEKKKAVTGAGGKSTYITSWFAWESLKFLDENDEHRGATLNNNPTSEDEAINENDLPAQNWEGNFDRNEENPLHSAASLKRKKKGAKTVLAGSRQATAHKFVSPNTFEPRSGGGIEDARVEEAYEMLKRQKTSGRKDECATFGDYIAEKLRKFDNTQRAILQNEIHGLVFQAEMDNLERAEQPADQRVSSYYHSYNPSRMLIPSTISASSVLSQNFENDHILPHELNYSR